MSEAIAILALLAFIVCTGLILPFFTLNKPTHDAQNGRWFAKNHSHSA